jgi:hypothetical protein
MNSFDTNTLASLLTIFRLHESDEEVKVAQLVVDDTNALASLLTIFRLHESDEEVKVAQLVVELDTQDLIRQEIDENEIREIIKADYEKLRYAAQSARRQNPGNVFMNGSPLFDILPRSSSPAGEIRSLISFLSLDHLKVKFVAPIFYVIRRW